MSANVRIDQESHRKLKMLADDMGVSMPTVLERAIEALRRQRFLERASRAYCDLRADKNAWAAEQAERADWETTLNDGLDQV